MDLPSILRIQAHANRLANHRLHGAMRTLPQAEFRARRTGYFPSLAETLNHILAVDLYYIGALSADACAASVAMDRGASRVQRDQVAHVLMHLFMHQTHHRGQAHAMLSGTPVAPPQLDEFVMPSDAHFRTTDMSRLGWNEADIYGASRR